jgi:hypothetical protein
MEINWAFAFGGFVAGWALRDWGVRAPEIPVCKCECNLTGLPGSEGTGFSGGNLVIYLLVIAGLGVAFSNTALALKVSFWDPSTGKDSSISVDVVKGRSKGVVGASRGLSIAN